MKKYMKHFCSNFQITEHKSSQYSICVLDDIPYAAIVHICNSF